MVPVLFKKLGDHDPLFIVDFGSFLHMQVQESAVVFFYVMVRRYRDKQVPSGRSYFVFDISFFISGIRVAETDPETIVGTKTGEQLRFMDLIHNWNERVTGNDTVYVLGDAFWKNEENSVKIIQRLNGHKHLIRGNHDRVHGRLQFHWESIEQYAEINDGNTLVIMSH